MAKESKNQGAPKQQGKKMVSLKRIGESGKNEEKAKRRASAKKVLYLEIDDEITTLYDRLKQIKIKNIYLVVPKRAILFQSIINLKILKQKAQDLEKNIYIITNDPNGIHLAKQVGLIVYDKLEGHDHPSLVSGKFLEDQQDISPLKASINALEDETPTRQAVPKLSISELIRKGKGAKLVTIAKKIALQPAKIKSPKTNENKSKFVLIAPNRQALVSLIVISLIILLSITYIALPGATIKLAPRTNTLGATKNITLVDIATHQAQFDNSSANVIPSYSISAPVKRALTYSATGKEFGEGSKNAQGTITIMNSSNQKWDLVSETRFQTSSGLVFRIKQSISVPAARGNESGKIEATVVADELDIYDQPIGERGNIGPTRFFLPKLSAESQKKIFAENKDPFSGGKTVVIKKITKADLEAAEAKLTDDLKNSAQSELQAVVEKRNRERKTNLVLLMGPQAIQTGTLKIDLPSHLEGQKLDSFDLQGELVATGVAYNRDELLNILKTELVSKRNPEKRLVYIQEDSLKYNVEEANFEEKKIKIFASISGREEFDIRPEEENGSRLVKSIKERVVGKDIDEAKEYIQGLREIARVKIESWPAWAPTMPSIPDNIRIEVE